MWRHTYTVTIKSAANNPDQLIMEITTDMDDHKVHKMLAGYDIRITHEKSEYVDTEEAKA